MREKLFAKSLSLILSFQKSFISKTDDIGFGYIFFGIFKGISFEKKYP